MIEHTPTPWALDKYGDVVHSAKGQVFITAFALSCGPRNKEAEANAQYIVKAVNYHDRMVEALRKCCADLDMQSDSYEDARALLTELEQQQ